MEGKIERMEKGTTEREKMLFSWAKGDRTRQDRRHSGDTEWMGEEWGKKDRESARRASPSRIVVQQSDSCDLAAARVVSEVLSRQNARCFSHSPTLPLCVIKKRVLMLQTLDIFPSPSIHKISLLPYKVNLNKQKYRLFTNACEFGVSRIRGRISRTWVSRASFSMDYFREK